MTDDFIRGFNFRALQGKNLHFVQYASFKSYRDRMQGLGRVGRYNDLCTRYLVKGVSEIDFDEQCTLWSAIN